MAWIDYLNLGRYHEKIKQWINENKYIHPSNHPATMIVQDYLNQFITKDEKNALANLIKGNFYILNIGNTETNTDFNSIFKNGVYFGNFNSLFTNGFLGKEQRKYNEFTMIVLGMNAATPILKTQIVFNRVTYEIYMRCCLSWQEPWNWGEWEKIYTQSSLNKSMTPYELILEPNTSIVNLAPIIGSKQLLENSFIYVDGIKLIKDVHYNINKTNKTVTILNPYNHKVNFEAIIFN